MERQKGRPAKKKNRRGQMPKDGENRFVLSKGDSDEHRGRIVAVAKFPVLGQYARPVAVDESIEGLKRDLCILGRLQNEEEVLPACIRPELEVFCYVVAANNQPQVIWKGDKQ